MKETSLSITRRSPQFHDFNYESSLPGTDSDVGEIEGDETSDSNTFTNSNGYKDDSSILLSHEILK